MNIDYLNYYKKVAELQSISKAAELFDISQPAVSKAIVQLEAEAGAPLFYRTNRRMVLTEAGRILFESIKNSTEKLNVGLDKVKGLSSEQLGTVNITAVSAPSLVAACVHEYLKINPYVNFKFSIPEGRHLPYSPVDSGVYFFANHINFPNIEKIPILYEKFAVIMHVEHPMANQKALALASLKNEKFVFYENLQGGPVDYTYELCVKAGFTPNIVFETDSTLVKNSLVAYGAAITLAPESILTSILRKYKTIVAVPLSSPEYTRCIYMGWSKSSHLTQVAKSFLDFAKQYFKNAGETEK